MNGERAARAASAERAAARFGELFRARVRLERDRALAEPLVLEARPVVEALHEGLAAVERADPSALELREALTLTRLLGRRAAVLGATPTAALALGPCLVEAATPDAPAAEALEEDLRAIALEGYVAAREEWVEEAGARRMADAIAVIEPAPGCMAVLPAGVQDEAELERVFDEVGRRLLDRDTRACVVHLGRLAAPDRERARRVFALHATCLMLGAVCIFTAVDEPWREAARDAGLDLGELRFEADFASGLRAALQTCGLELRARAGLGEVLRRTFTRR